MPVVGRAKGDLVMEWVKVRDLAAVQGGVEVAGGLRLGAEVVGLQEMVGGVRWQGMVEVLGRRVMGAGGVKVVVVVEVVGRRLEKVVAGVAWELLEVRVEELWRVAKVEEMMLVQV
jgi:hypothetical protein